MYAILSIVKKVCEKKIVVIAVNAKVFNIKIVRQGLQLMKGSRLNPFLTAILLLLLWSMVD